MSSVQQQLTERNQRMQARNHNNHLRRQPENTDPHHHHINDIAGRNQQQWHPLPQNLNHAQWQDPFQLQQNMNAMQQRIQQQQQQYQHNMDRMQHTLQQNMNAMHRRQLQQQQRHEQHMNRLQQEQELRQQQQQEHVQRMNPNNNNHHQMNLQNIAGQQQQQYGQIQSQAVHVVGNEVFIRTSNAQPMNHNHNHNNNNSNNMMTFNYPRDRLTNVRVADGPHRRQFEVRGSFVVENGEIRAHHGGLVRQLIDGGDDGDRVREQQQQRQLEYRNPNPQLPALEPVQAAAVAEEKQMENENENESALYAVQSVVPHLPVRAVTAQELQRHAPQQPPTEAYECRICMERYKETDIVMTLPCFHEYHGQCIREWLQEHTYCPVCMHEVNQLV